MSEYDNIKTAEELVTHVKLHGGFSVKQEDINRAQEIFGRMPEPELARIANDEKLQDTFYSILFSIWSWEDATWFFNKFTNQLYIEGQAAVKKLADYEKELADCKEKISSLEMMVQEESEAHRNADRECDRLEYEVLRLKAKLYDYEHRCDDDNEVFSD